MREETNCATFKEWAQVGRKVFRGEKAVVFDEHGRHCFRKDQTYDQASEFKYKTKITPDGKDVICLGPNTIELDELTIKNDEPESEKGPF